MADNSGTIGNSKAIDFLNAFFGKEPWPLVAISRKEGEKPELTCITFCRSDDREQRASTWIALKNVNEDIYFDINPLKAPINRKANKADIAESRYLWADMDPPKALNYKDQGLLDAWRKSINHDVYPVGVPGLPTLIVDSGRGFWYLWKLKVPHPTDSFVAGKDENGKDIIEDGPLTLRIEAFGRGLEKAYNSDNVRDIPRIARLPGTINFKTGRTASVKSYNSQRLYSYEDFPFETEKASPGSGPTTDVFDPDLPPIPFVFEDMGKRLQNIIMGQHADEFDSRSEAVMSAARFMVQQRVSDDDGANVLLNPAYPISEHCLAQAKTERTRRKYALAQMAKARKLVAATGRVKERPGLRFVLNRNDPAFSAGEIMKAYYMEDEEPVLIHFQEIFYRWTGMHYKEIPEELMNRDLWKLLETAYHRTEEGVYINFSPNRSRVGEVTAALAAKTQLDYPCKFPHWRGDEPFPAKEMLSCKNGLLHIKTRRLMDHTPQFRNINSFNYVYDPTAPRPTLWLEFLDELWADDEQSKETLQEIFGLMLTCDTSFQKAFLLIGPKRAGKGTIGRILTELVGEDNVVNPTLSSLEAPYGKEPLINTLMALIADARLSGKTDVQTVAENLLSITGEDKQTIGRKYKRAWNGYLLTRFILLTNQLPRFEDASNALVDRFIILKFTHEIDPTKRDPALTEKLKCELPQILNWALDGLKRLMDRQRFIMPRSAEETAEEFEALSNPIGVFIKEHCVLGPEHIVRPKELWQAWVGWCKDHGYDYPGSTASFSVKLHAFIPGVKTIRRGTREAQERYLAGIGFKINGSRGDDNVTRLPF